MLFLLYVFYTYLWTFHNCENTLSQNVTWDSFSFARSVIIIELADYTIFADLTTLSVGGQWLHQKSLNQKYYSQECKYLRL